MRKQGDVHVVYYKAPKVWRVEVTGTGTPPGATRQRVDRARKLAPRAKSELVVRNQDGTIGERRTYGRDPFSPRGFAIVSAACLRSS